MTELRPEIELAFVAFMEPHDADIAYPVHMAMLRRAFVAGWENGEQWAYDDMDDEPSVFTVPQFAPGVRLFDRNHPPIVNPLTRKDTTNDS